MRLRAFGVWGICLFALLIAGCGGGGTGITTGSVDPLPDADVPDGLELPRKQLALGSSRRWTFRLVGGGVSGGGQSYSFTSGEQRAQTLATMVPVTTIYGPVEALVQRTEVEARLSNGDRVDEVTEKLVRSDEDGRWQGIWVLGLRNPDDPDDVRATDYPMLIRPATWSVGWSAAHIYSDPFTGITVQESYEIVGTDVVETPQGVFDVFVVQGRITTITGGIAYVVDLTSYERPDLGLLKLEQRATASGEGVATSTTTMEWVLTHHQTHGWTSNPLRETPRTPDVACFFVSGHTPTDWGDIEREYLSYATSAGPYLVTEIAKRGHEVIAGFYSDNGGEWEPYETVSNDGTLQAGPRYEELLDDLEYVGWRWPNATILVVAHSHGGVWAHAACREVEGRLDPGRVLLVDLDTNSLDWSQLHDCEEVVGACNSADELEEQVFDCVRANLELRPDTLWLDFESNHRTDGSTANLVRTVVPNTSHSSIHEPPPEKDALLEVMTWFRAWTEFTQFVWEDQEQLHADALYWIEDRQVHWQEFVPSKPWFGGASVKMMRLGDPGMLILDLVDETGNVVGRGYTRATRIPDETQAWVPFHFGPGVAVTPGETYRLELRAHEPFQAPNYVWVMGSETAVYRADCTSNVTAEYPGSPPFVWTFRTWSEE